MKSFANKVAAITGAASGMGRALALSLGRRGCHLALCDVSEPGLAETAQLVSRAGVEVTTKHVDVSKRDQVYSWAADVVRDHGRVNLVVNNAGVAYASTIAGADYEHFERIVGINFWGVVYGTKAFLPHLEASGETYNATKFAVRGFTETLREELEMTGSKVSATCVHPGGIRTNIARSGKVDESLRDLGVSDVGESKATFERRMFRTTAEDAAETILRGVERNARRVLVGVDAHAIDAIQRLLPARYQWIVARTGRRLLG